MEVFAPAETAGLAQRLHAHERIASEGAMGPQTGHTDGDFWTFLLYTRHAMGTYVDSHAPESPAAIEAYVASHDQGWTLSSLPPATRERQERAGTVLLPRSDVESRLRPCALRVDPGDLLIMQPYTLHAASHARGLRSAHFKAAAPVGSSQRYGSEWHTLPWNLALEADAGVLAAHLVHSYSDYDVARPFPAGMREPLAAAASAAQAVDEAVLSLSLAATRAAAEVSRGRGGAATGASASAMTQATAGVRAAAAELMRAYHSGA